MDSDLIVLPRAAVEGLKEYVNAMEYGPGADHRAKVCARLDALLAAAKPVVDAGAMDTKPFEHGHYIPAFDVLVPGTYRVLLIAADAAEEG